MKYLLVLLTLLFDAFVVSAQMSDSAAVQSLLSDSLKPLVLDEVTVRSRKPLLQLLPGKTIVNVEAAITNTGANILEVLERSPGVTIDRSGNISLKGRQGVLVMIDGKPASINGADLNNLLSGLSASQVETIEIMDQPPAKYDAAGNAGIINIRMKKNRQRGFNGNLSLSLAQGKLTRTMNTISLNYNTGRINLFSNITVNHTRQFSNLYAFRHYYEADNRTLTSMLEQPSHFQGRTPSQTFRMGLDYYINKRVTLGIVTSETRFVRTSTGNNTAIWMDKFGNTDSLITTRANNRDKLNNHSINLNGRYIFSAASELTADFDYLGYRIRNQQFYNNTLTGTAGYDEDVTGNLPSNLDIFTGKADYTHRPAEGWKLEVGWKSSHVRTNNRAEYFLRTGDSIYPDYNKTNHFIYIEDIHAGYINAERKMEKWLLQAGVRYEATSYNANQLGNAIRKDSSFSRRYDGVFPTITASYDIDSSHSIAFSAGRRIDRPSFHSLNPFVFIINKYTFQAGNPFYRPQYTWNYSVTHTFKNLLVTTLSYSRTKDYFSQVFLQDDDGIIYYSEGNLDRMDNFGLTISLQTHVTRWWSVSAFTALNHKKIRGFVWDQRRTARTQANFNVNNQFTLGKGWSGEVTGVWQLHEQELQEITDPTGQFGLGVGKQILKNKGVVKLAFRDIFYTQAMKGFTIFEQSTEYFKIVRDSRMASISFTYRFGTSVKTPARRNTGGAEDEMRRAGG